MSYGGPPTAAMTSTAASAPPSSTTKQVKLERESELRIKVANDMPLRLRLLNGTAEIFGTELLPEMWLTIEIDGTTETYYTADEVWFMGHLLSILFYQWVHMIIGYNNWLLD